MDGNTYTADGAPRHFIIGGQTLSPGGVITVSSTLISYAAAGTDVVVGGSTEAVGIGGLIMSELGGGDSDAARTGVARITGGAVEEMEWSGVGLGMALAMMSLSIFMCVHYRFKHCHNLCSAGYHPPIGRTCIEY